MTTIDPNRTMIDRCFAANVRVERIVHLATMACGEPIEEDLFELLTDDWAPFMAELLGITSGNLDEALNQWGDRRDAREEALQQALNWHPLTGWIVAASHPVYTKMGASLGFTWAIYDTKPFYADTYDAALEQAITWAEAEQQAALGDREDAR